MVDLGRVTHIVRGVAPMVLNEQLSSQVTVKGDADYVTGTDTTVQQYLYEKLSELCPEAAFVAEEQASNPYSSRLRWIVDPIDGTTNLTHGFGMSAVSVALYDGDEGLYGAIYNPYHDELFVAERGRGAYLNGRRIYCSGRDKMKDCLAVAEYSPYYKHTSQDVFEIHRRLFMRCQDVRSLGAAAIGLAYVAAGRADIFMSPRLQPWDIAAAMVLISEAGGKTADLAGKPLRLDCCTEIMAGNGHIWEELAEFSAEYSGYTVKD